jgi:hypothetical protein
MLWRWQGTTVEGTGAGSEGAGTHARAHAKWGREERSRARRGEGTGGGTRAREWELVGSPRFARESQGKRRCAEEGARHCDAVMPTATPVPAWCVCRKACFGPHLQNADSTADACACAQHAKASKSRSGTSSARLGLLLASTARRPAACDVAWRAAAERPAPPPKAGGGRMESELSPEEGASCILTCARSCVRRRRHAPRACAGARARRARLQRALAQQTQAPAAACDGGGKRAFSCFTTGCATRFCPSAPRLTRGRRCTRTVRAELLALTRLGGLALREEVRVCPWRGAARAHETLAVPPLPALTPG